MRFSQTIDQAREDLTEQARRVVSSVEETGNLVAFALVTVSCIAALALVVALTVEARQNAGKG